MKSLSDSICEGVKNIIKDTKFINEKSIFN